MHSQSKIVDINNTSDYGWDETSAPHSYNYITPRILKILKNFQIKSVADLGSGNGFLCGQLEKNCFKVIGIERDLKGCEISSKKYSGITFYNLGVESNPLDLLKTEDKFDAVISTEVIEHLYSPHLLPLFAGAILKKDGILIVSTPYHGYIKNIILSIFNHWDDHHTPLWHGGHIKFWSKKTLTKLLSDYGFRVIKFYGAGRFIFLWKSMIIVAKKN